MFDSHGFMTQFKQLIENDLDEEMLQISRFHFQQPGSLTRARLTFNCSIAMQLPFETAIHCAALVEMLHNASLIHDDIQDNAVFRRGQKSLCQQFGLAKALAYGDLLISMAYHTTSLLPYSCIGSSVRLIHHCVTKTITGQVRDINAITLKKPQLPHYENICWLKSGQLMMLGIKLATLISEHLTECSLFEAIIRHLVISYQIVDDITDMEEDKNQLNFSIFNVFNQDNPILLSQAQELASNHLHQAQAIIHQLPQDIRQPFLQLYHNIQPRLIKDVV
ncbi:polyprenyl synthetase family protein [Legionella worsleiensis]|uniref:Geranyltranstransferase n=1 Tax=Legionella worsleiensis TaxID=45076 RepID=A0A0W1AF69_9GAMM|nr:polyprenyl synthetase family protein [Legionella worsleiensis]KTD79795.1 geranyltranstransferase [Legionella worsleiensis]STY32306.1 geranyltranstransferase [Legionella worsleiensis]